MNLKKKRTVALNLTVAQIRGLADEGAKGKESMALSENEEPVTGPRAGFSGLSRCVHLNANANVGRQRSPWRNAERSKPHRKTINPFFASPSFPLSFGSFDFASITIRRLEHAVLRRFYFLGNCPLSFTSSGISIKIQFYQISLSLSFSFSLNRSLQTVEIKAVDV